MTKRRELFVELVAPCSINEASLPHWFADGSSATFTVLPGTSLYRLKGLT